MIRVIFLNQAGIGRRTYHLPSAAFCRGRTAAAGITLLGLYSNFESTCFTPTVPPEWLSYKKLQAPSWTCIIRLRSDDVAGSWKGYDQCLQRLAELLRRDAGVFLKACEK